MASFLRNIFETPREMGKTLQASWYFRQAQEHQKLYQQSLTGGREDLSELNKAIEFLQKAASKVSEGELDHTFERRQIWFTLASAFQMRFDRTGEINDLDEAIRCIRECNDFSTSEGQQVEMTSNLANLLGYRYAKAGDSSNLDEALSLLAGVEGEVSGEAVSDITFFTARLFLLRLQFDLNHDLRDIDQSIYSGQRAIRLLERTKGLDVDLPEGVSAKLLGLLGLSMYIQALAVGDIPALTEAIKTLRRAIEESPADLPDRFLFASGLCNAMTERYIRAGNPQDLKDAIKLIEPAVAAAQGQINPSEYAQILCNYGVSLGWESHRTGDTKLLNQSIDRISQALRLVAYGDFDNSTMQMNLGTWLLMRYRRFSALADLDGAITAFQSADHRFPENSPRRVETAGNLCAALGDRFARTAVLEDLNEAIKCGRRACDEAHPGDHVAQAKFLNNLAARLCVRYEFFLSKRRREDDTDPDTVDLDEAIKYLMKATKVVPSTYPLRGGIYSSLSYALALRFKAHGVENDLNDAVLYARLAVDVTPDTDPTKALYLHHYGERLFLKARSTEDPQDVEKIWKVYKRAFEIESAPPSLRIEMAKMAGIISLVRPATAEHPEPGDWATSYKMLCDALDLLPQVSTRNLSRDDHQHLLRKLSGVSAFAAAVALQIGEPPSTALALLESGRGIMAGLAIDSQEDVSRLKGERPALFDKYTDLTDLLSTPLPMPSQSILPPQAAPALANMATELSIRTASANELRRLQAEIRMVPGLEHFQEPLSDKQMRAIASSGPVVLFNATAIRCDAFIITCDEIRTIPLPLVRYDEVQQNLKLLAAADPDDRITHLRKRTDKKQHNDRLREILSWLWDVAVRPVLADLTLLDPDPSGLLLPQIWWVTAGPLGMMPLHAAGSNWIDSTENTAGHVVSCYIPTVKALSYVHDKVARRPKDLVRSFTCIAVPKTKGKADLDGVIDRMSHVQALLGRSGITKQTILDSPSKEELLAQLQDASLIHFACHATSDTDDPSNSRLYLRADKNGEPECLTVRDLGGVQLHHSQPGLAYLSACSTSESVAESLADEALNIANAFQLLGFPHVIGTLWEAEVDAANRLADSFYEHFVEGLENSAIADKSVVFSYALHYALQDLRTGKGTRRRASLCCNDVLAWAPFIYVGY